MGGFCRVQGVGDVDESPAALPGVLVHGGDAGLRRLWHAESRCGLHQSGQQHPPWDCEAQEKASSAPRVGGCCASMKQRAGGVQRCERQRGHQGALLPHGAGLALMTGSGAAVFGVFETEPSRPRRRWRRSRPSGRRSAVAGPDKGRRCPVVKTRWLL